MARFPPEEVARVARLCRLRLTDAERDALSRELEALADSFSGLAAFAADLPAAPEAEPLPEGALRDDEPAPAPLDEVEGILRASPRLDPATRLLRGPRGGA